MLELDKRKMELSCFDAWTWEEIELSFFDTDQVSLWAVGAVGLYNISNFNLVQLQGQEKKRHTHTF